jgi:hypothetical protein
MALRGEPLQNLPAATTAANQFCQGAIFLRPTNASPPICRINSRTKRHDRGALFSPPYLGQERREGIPHLQFLGGYRTLVFLKDGDAFVQAIDNQIVIGRGH